MLSNSNNILHLDGTKKIDWRLLWCNSGNIKGIVWGCHKWCRWTEKNSFAVVAFNFKCDDWRTHCEWMLQALPLRKKIQLEQVCWWDMGQHDSWATAHWLDFIVHFISSQTWQLQQSMAWQTMKKLDCQSRPSTFKSDNSIGYDLIYQVANSTKNFTSHSSTIDLKG